eukprot:TRINITY_DN66080_c5_g2_i3.p1 TRINITY_DN66080_c5_g2~~TRINITY_DN66080_c5_g2_i3.p1  ORF type:complete len:510 (+),score=204.95 TRINITY_DN66080_c5_g2_i3:722-2251(+)
MPPLDSMQLRFDAHDAPPEVSFSPPMVPEDDDGTIEALFRRHRVRRRSSRRRGHHHRLLAREREAQRAGDPHHHHHHHRRRLRRHRLRDDDDDDDEEQEQQRHDDDDGDDDDESRFLITSPVVISPREPSVSAAASGRASSPSTSPASRRRRSAWAQHVLLSELRRTGILSHLVDPPESASASASASAAEDAAAPSSNAESPRASGSAAGHGGDGALNDELLRVMFMVPPSLWDQLMRDGVTESERVTRADMNELLMNYFIVAGMQDVAETFQAECGVQPHVPLNSISDRVSVRKHVLAGRIEQAVAQLNVISPDILRHNPDLDVKLKQQQVLELIRQRKIQAAMVYSRTELAHLCTHKKKSDQDRDESNRGSDRKRSHKLLRQMQRILSLLAFPNPEQTAPNRHLLQQEHRDRLANHVNRAILNFQSQGRDSRLPLLLQWASLLQRRLDELPVLYPRIDDFATGEFVLPQRRPLSAWTLAGRLSSDRAKPAANSGFDIVSAVARSLST